MGDHEYRDQEIEHPVIALGVVMMLGLLGTIAHMAGLGF